MDVHRSSGLANGVMVGAFTSETAFRHLPDNLHLYSHKTRDIPESIEDVFPEQAPVDTLAAVGLDGDLEKSLISSDTTRFSIARPPRMVEVPTYTELELHRVMENYVRNKAVFSGISPPSIFSGYSHSSPIETSPETRNVIRHLTEGRGHEVWKWAQAL